MRAADLIPLIQQEAIRQGTDPGHAIAIFMAENSGKGGFDPNRQMSLSTISPRGAVGVMQVLPSTLQGLIKNGYVSADTTLNDLTGQIRAGVAAVKEAASYGDGSLRDTAIRYNASMDAWKSYKNTGRLPEETVGYLAKLQSFGANLGGSANPNVGAFSSSSMQSDVADLAGIMKRALGQRDAAMSEYASSTDAANRSATAEARAGQAAITAKANTAISQEQNLARLLNVFGINSQDPQSRISQANEAFTKAAATERLLAPEVDKALAINPLDDPIGFIMARFQLMKQLPQLNSAREKKESAVREISQWQQITATQAQLERPAQQAAILEQTAAEREFIAAQADAKRAANNRELAGARVSNIMAEAQFQQELLGRKIQLQDLALRAATFDDRRDAQKELADSILQVNNGLQLLGLDPQNKAQIKLLDKNTADELAKLGAGGSTTPGRMLSIALEMNSVERLIANPATAARGQFLKDLYGAAGIEAERLLANPQTAAAYSKLKPVELTAKAADNVMAEWVKERDTKPMNTVAQANPLRMNVGVYATAPELQNNGFTKYVAELRKSDPKIQLDEKLLLSGASAMANQGVPLERIAESLAEFTEKGYLHQFKITGLGTLGVPVKSGKAGLEYKVAGERFDEAGSLNPLRFPKAAVVDLMNPTDISNYLMRLAVAEKISPAIGQPFYMDK